MRVFLDECVDWRLSFDLTGHEVQTARQMGWTSIRNGELLSLTSAEFDVLVFLAGHPKSIVTPHTMLATNWGSGRVRQEEFLRVLMSLATKLDSASGKAQRYIRTEPWIIYRFDPEASSVP